MTTGATVCTIDNLTITNSLLAGFDFPGGCIIKGNLLVNAGTLRFNPSSGMLMFDGTSSQAISGGGNIEIGANCDVIVGAPSTTLLNRDLILGKDIVILSGGKLTINPGITLIVNGQAIIN